MGKGKEDLGHGLRRMWGDWGNWLGLLDPIKEFELIVLAWESGALHHC